ncbi:hypothetical protein D3C87_1336570 [compost metagenome]
MTATQFHCLPHTPARREDVRTVPGSRRGTIWHIGIVLQALPGILAAVIIPQSAYAAPRSIDRIRSKALIRQSRSAGKSAIVSVIQTRKIRLIAERRIVDRGRHRRTNLTPANIVQWLHSKHMARLDITRLRLERLTQFVKKSLGLPDNRSTGIIRACQRPVHLQILVRIIGRRRTRHIVVQTQKHIRTALEVNTGLQRDAHSTGRRIALT